MNALGKEKMRNALNTGNRVQVGISGKIDDAINFETAKKLKEAGLSGKRNG